MFVSYSIYSDTLLKKNTWLRCSVTSSRTHLNSRFKVQSSVSGVTALRTCTLLLGRMSRHPAKSLIDYRPCQVFTTQTGFPGIFLNLFQLLQSPYNHTVLPFKLFIFLLSVQHSFSNISLVNSQCFFFLLLAFPSFHFMYANMTWTVKPH